MIGLLDGVQNRIAEHRLFAAVHFHRVADLANRRRRGLLAGGQAAQPVGNYQYTCGFVTGYQAQRVLVVCFLAGCSVGVDSRRAAGDSERLDALAICTQVEFRVARCYCHVSVSRYCRS